MKHFLRHVNIFLFYVKRIIFYYFFHVKFIIFFHVKFISRGRAITLKFYFEEKTSMHLYQETLSLSVEGLSILYIVTCSKFSICYYLYCILIKFIISLYHSWLKHKVIVFFLFPNQVRTKTFIVIIKGKMLKIWYARLHNNTH